MKVAALPAYFGGSKGEHEVSDLFLWTISYIGKNWSSCLQTQSTRRLSHPSCFSCFTIKKKESGLSSDSATNSTNSGARREITCSTNDYTRKKACTKRTQTIASCTNPVVQVHWVVHISSHPGVYYPDSSYPAGCPYQIRGVPVTLGYSVMA